VRRVWGGTRGEKGPEEREWERGGVGELLRDASDLGAVMQGSKIQVRSFSAPQLTTMLSAKTVVCSAKLDTPN